MRAENKYFQFSLARSAAMCFVVVFLFSKEYFQFSLARSAHANRHYTRGQLFSFNSLLRDQVTGTFTIRPRVRLSILSCEISWGKYRRGFTWYDAFNSLLRDQWGYRRTTAYTLHIFQFSLARSGLTIFIK